MTPSSARLAAALAAAAGVAAALPACSYSYRNPAEALGAGEVAGRISGAAPAGGVTVSLRGADLSSASRAEGRFALLPLPVGRHRLLFRQGRDRAAQYDVELGWGKDGRAQGLWVGELTVPASAGIAGSCTLQGGGALGDDGVAVDEATGAVARVSAGATGQFAFDGLPVGLHRIRVHATDGAGHAYLGGPVDVELGPDDAGLQRVLAPVTLRPATTATASVSLRVALVGSAPDVALADLPVTGLGAVMVQSNGFAQVDLAEGLWTAGLGVPAGTGLHEPPPLTFVVLAGEAVDLGTLYAVAPSARTQAALACHLDADCAPGHCSGRTCAGYTPPDTAAASTPLCDASTRGCTAGAALGTSSPVTLTCVAGTSATMGVPCAAWCTPDGVETLTSRAGAGGCP